MVFLRLANIFTSPATLVSLQLHVAQTVLPCIQRKHSQTPGIPHYARRSWGYPLHRALPQGRALHSLSQYHHHCRYSLELYHEVAQTTRLSSDDDVSQPSNISHLVLQTSYRNHINAILATISVRSNSNQNHFKRRHLHLFGVNLFRQ